MFYLMVVLGVLPIVVIILLIGYFAGRKAKQHHKNRLLYGGLAVVFITAIALPYIPRWAGAIAAIEMEIIHAVGLQMQSGTTQPPDPNAIDRFTLTTEENIYTFNLPATYQAKQTSSFLVDIYCKYPAMEPTQQRMSGEDGLYIQLTPSRLNQAQSFVDRVAANASKKILDDEHPHLDRYVGKQGRYDLYQSQNKVMNRTETTYVFTAKDGQQVLVEPLTFKHRISRNITPDIAIRYQFSSGIGNDFIKIDEVVTDFIKTHLQSKPATKENTR